MVIILRHMLIDPGRTGREELGAYLARGGYRGLTGLGPDQIIALVEAAHLRGRGGSGLGLPVAAKWREVRKGAPGRRYDNRSPPTSSAAPSARGRPKAEDIGRADRGRYRPSA